MSDFTLEDARKCLSNWECSKCRFNSSDISCRELALEMGATAVNYMLVGKKLVEEAEGNAKSNSKRD